MNPLEKLRAERGDLQNQIETIEALVTKEERERTVEECDAINALMDKQDAIDTQINTIERLAARPQTEPPTAAEMGVVVAGPLAESDKYSLGEYLQEIVAASRGKNMPRVVNYQKRVIEAATATGASEAVPADGGFLVGTDFGGSITERSYDNSQVMSRVTRRTISSGANGITFNGIDETSRATGSRWGGIRSYWLAEAAAKTKSKPTFRQIKLELNKHAVLFYATDESLADAVALEQQVSEAVAGEIAFVNQDAVIEGTGAGQPQGILGSGALVTVAKETGQAAKSIVYENIINMWARKWGDASRYIWLVNSDTFPQIARMNVAVGTGGVPVYLPAGGASVSPFSTLMGIPVIEIEQCSTVGTVGDIMLVDLSQYIVIEKGGVQAAMSIHVQFLEDETVFRWVTRIDGQSIWNAPLTPFKGGSSKTKSPFGVLATRS